MKLYYMPGACSLADHIVLEWIGKPYQVRRMSHDELKMPDYLRINPNGSVPALEDDDGWVLIENVAILGYLADLNPQLGLAGDGSPRSRAEIMRWLALINSDVHKAFLPIFAPAAFVADPDTHDELKANARKRLRPLFAQLDGRLHGRHWLGDKQRSIADPYLFVVTRWARSLGVDLSGMSNLDAFMQRMEADPAVRKVLAAEGLD